MKRFTCTSYEEALKEGYIGINEYLRQANTGLSKDMLKKILAVFKVKHNVIKSDYEQTSVYKKEKLDYVLMVFYPTITKRTKTWHNSKLVAGDFMCNTSSYKKYLGTLKNPKVKDE